MRMMEHMEICYWNDEKEWTVTDVEDATEFIADYLDGTGVPAYAETVVAWGKVDEYQLEMLTDWATELSESDTVGMAITVEDADSLGIAALDGVEGVAKNCALTEYAEMTIEEIVDLQEKKGYRT